MAIGLIGTGALAVPILTGSAVLNGLLAPPLLALIMVIANNPAVMGERVNGRGLNLLGWETVALMTAAAGALLLSLLRL